jgi:hypothetical protein
MVCCFPLYLLAQDTLLCKLDIRIGNGLSIHPSKNIVLISKPNGLKDDDGKPFYSIYRLEIADSSQVSYHKMSINSPYTDYHPVFAPHGKFILFNSTRPKPGKKTTSGKTDIWYADYKKRKFRRPKYLKEINTAHHESYPTITKNNRLYFNSDRPGGKGMMDIYQADLVKGKWINIQNVAGLNSPMSENDLFVDPDENFMILNRYDPDTREIDLFISYQEKGNWSIPEKINSINQSNVWELTPTLSPNVQWLFLEIDGQIQCFPTKNLLNP